MIDSTTLVVLGMFLVAATADAPKADAVKEDPAHEELRAVKKGVEEAYQKRDIDAILKYLHPNVVLTWQNSQTMHGHKGMREFYERMMVGDKSVVVNIDSKAEVDALSILYGGDTAVAFGSLDDHFKLRDGMEFDLKSRWTATLVKEDGRWQIVGFQVGTNMFDNGVLELIVKKVSYLMGGSALALGILVGLLLALLFSRLRKKPV